MLQPLGPFFQSWWSFFLTTQRQCSPGPRCSLGWVTCWVIPRGGIILDWKVRLSLFFFIFSLLPAFFRLVGQLLISVQIGFLIRTWHPSRLEYCLLLIDAFTTRKGLSILKIELAGVIINSRLIHSCTPWERVFYHWLGPCGTGWKRVKERICAEFVELCLSLKKNRKKDQFLLEDYNYKVSTKPLRYIFLQAPLLGQPCMVPEVSLCPSSLSGQWPSPLPSYFSSSFLMSSQTRGKRVTEESRWRLPDLPK